MNMIRYLAERHDECLRTAKRLELNGQEDLEEHTGQATGLVWAGCIVMAINPHVEENRKLVLKKYRETLKAV